MAIAWSNRAFCLGRYPIRIIGEKLTYPMEMDTGAIGLKIIADLNFNVVAPVGFYSRARILSIDGDHTLFNAIRCQCSIDDVEIVLGDISITGLVSITKMVLTRRVTPVMGHS